MRVQPGYMRFSSLVITRESRQVEHVPFATVERRARFEMRWLARAERGPGVERGVHPIP
jgi:hypothetical protein